MGSLVSDTQSALPRHRACCNRKPGNGTRAVFVAISGTSASRERFQRVSTRLTRTHLYLCNENSPSSASGHPSRSISTFSIFSKRKSTLDTRIDIEFKASSKHRRRELSWTTITILESRLLRYRSITFIFYRSGE